MRFGLGFAQGRQQQTGENRDDSDDDEQFDQREAAVTLTAKSVAPGIIRIDGVGVDCNRIPGFRLVAMEAFESLRIKSPVRPECREDGSDLS